MGAMNLKAIAVRAARKIATADPDAVLAAARDRFQSAVTDLGGYSAMEMGRRIR